MISVDNYYDAGIYRELEDRPGLIWDTRWCMDNLFIVRSKGGEIIPFRRNETQRQIMATMRPTRAGIVVSDIYMKGRQIGCTTFWLLYGLVSCLLRSNHKAGFITQSEEDAKEAFRKVRLAWTSLPAWLKDAMGWKLIEERSDGYVFGHGSTFRCAVGVVGDTLDLLHVSEYGPISRKYPQKAKEIRQGSFPAVSPGGRIIVESTNRETGGEFLDIWNMSVEELASVLIGLGVKLTPDAFMARDYMINNAEYPGIYKQINERMDGFVPHFFTWWQDKGYVDTGVGQDFKITDSECERRERVKALYGVEISNEQFGWYRKQMRLQGETVKQEHPDTVEDALAGGSRLVFALDKQVGIGPINEYEGYRIWEAPRSDSRYTIGVDLSEGTGRDRSVIKIIRDASDGKWEVASWASSTAELDEVVNKVVLGYIMYGGKIIPEMNFNGAGFMELLLRDDRIDIGDIYRREVWEEKRKKSTRKLGWKTTRSSKPKMISRLERELRLGTLRIRDYEGIAECRTYVRGDNGSTNALSNKRDDMVISYALALQGVEDRHTITPSLGPSLPVPTKNDIMDNEESYYLNNGICLG
jgi:hypothetical protein